MPGLHAVIYLVDISECPDFNTMYELYDPCTCMFFFRNKVRSYRSSSAARAAAHIHALSSSKGARLMLTACVGSAVVCSTS